ncbi:MAG: DUF370 domain-containing protein [Alicyclobacillaceae bacterium]|nr:DUF370 domain-containing protein [Alicyclobacillaceae bacterium]
MFIHIGGDTMIHCKEIIGIFDIRAKSNGSTAPLFELACRNQAIQMVETGDPRSFVVTDRMVYCSPISSLTLKRRAEQLWESAASVETD